MASALDKAKTNFRQTKAWKDFRKKMMFFDKPLKSGKTQKVKACDDLTGSKLTALYNLHHMRVCRTMEEYKDLNPAYFLRLNNKSHEFLHWAYSQFIKDPKFLERLNHYLNLMALLNEGQDF